MDCLPGSVESGSNRCYSLHYGLIPRRPAAGNLTYGVSMKTIYLTHVALFIIIGSIVFMSGFTPEFIA